MKVAADKTLTLPAHVKYEDAAAFILVNMTAWRMLVTQARLRAGEDLLVIGVGGGVSSTAVQIGKLCGARVWVTSSSDDKLARARELGADECINHAREDWARVVWEKTGKRGVDVVLSFPALLIMLLGGATMDGPRHIWWNFVSSSKERIEQAKADWRDGRFAKVPGDAEFIPLPDR